ncbi:MAG TPA: secretin N-terminal domain-containing protein [Steroidobacteraceae bacterium]
MKKSGVWAVCALAALSMAASAQESSKTVTGGIEVSDLIGRVAKRLGKQFVIDPRVHAQISLAGLEPSQITYEQLLTILDVYQLVVAESAGLVTVVPDTNARQLVTPVYSDAGFTARDGELVTLLVTPRNVCAPWLVPVLRPLMPQAAHLAAVPQTNSLIINDRAGNVRRIAGMVEQMDKLGKGLADCPPPNPYAAADPARGAPARTRD